MDLQFELTTPVGDDRPIYLTGTFNQWQIADTRFQLQKIAAGKYFLDFPKHIAKPWVFEYKYVRGNWGQVEIDEYGNRIKNRHLNHPSGRVYDFVPRWRHNGAAFNAAFLPKIETVGNSFYIPQLDKSRKISILLPHHYYESDYRFPVLYMQDGQNLFDKNAPFGTWGVDEKMAILAESGIGDFIVVGIDHGNDKRINEYTPANELPIGIGHGEGTKYLDFVANTLKPYIDEKYRTLPDRANTGFGGSSMGGLISHYAALHHSETFSKVMVFSPSLWIYPEVYNETRSFHPHQHTKFYLFGGAKEGSNMVGNLFHIRDILEDKRQENMPIDLKIVIDPEGMHTEGRWSEEFPRAVTWLFYNR
jgi:predicted alpha/beta superfamily hydrolase